MLKHLRSRFVLSEVPASLVYKTSDSLYLCEIDSLRAVGNRVIVRMQTRVQKHRRNIALQKRPLVAAAQQVRSIVIVIHSQRQIEFAVCCAQYSGQFGAKAVS